MEDDEGSGLSEAAILAAYVLQNNQDDRRSSSSSVGSAGGYYTATSTGGCASFRSLSSGFGSGRRPPSASSGACVWGGPVLEAAADLQDLPVQTSATRRNRQEPQSRSTSSQ